MKKNEHVEETTTLKVTRAVDLHNKLKEEPEPKIVWNGIVEGSKGLIVGVSKTGKTTLAENLAISLAVGKTEFFGYPLQGTPEKVLFINLEESYRVRGRRNIKQLETLNTKEVSIFNENYFSTPENFPEFMINESSWECLHDYIKAVEPKYIFIDSLSHMFDGQIENSDPSMKFVKRFRDYVTSLGKTVVVVHHNTKGNDKPVTQDSIAGSRIIAQEFEYAIALANIPTSHGGHYLCKLYNKYFENDETAATLYKVNENNWVQNIGIANKFDLYKDTVVDYRFNEKNKQIVYEYIVSQSSQDSQTIIETADLSENLVNTKIMSKDTLHKSLGKLIGENIISKGDRGQYLLTKNEDDGRNIQGN